MPGCERHAIHLVVRRGSQRLRTGRRWLEFHPILRLGISFQERLGRFDVLGSLCVQFQRLRRSVRVAELLVREQ